MDWPFNDPDFEEHDLENVFKYSTRENVALLRNCGSKEVKYLELDTEEGWAEWLSNDMFSLHQQPRPGLGVILAARAEENEKHNSAILEYLPFSKDTFDQLSKGLPLHGDIARIINRSDQAIFADIDLRETEYNALFYCCRTTSKYPGDVAVSSVFYPKSGFTAAVFFGCDETLREDITGRMYTAENATSHPLLIMGIVAEVERERHSILVRDQVFQLLGRVSALSNPVQITTDSTMKKDHYSVESWFKISQLRSELQTWKVQLAHMVEQIDQLEEEVFTEQSYSSPSTFKDAVPESPTSDTTQVATDDLDEVDEKLIKQQEEHTSTPDEVDWRQHGRQTGRRIKRRLREIMNDYDQRIRECTMVIDGLILATQMSWNQIGYQDTQTNLRIASDTKLDSGQMKSIATLTMIFLPATFVSSVFSMTFFNWSPTDGKGIVSPYTWIYPVIVVGITLVVFGVWWFCTRRRKSRAASVSPV